MRSVRKGKLASRVALAVTITATVIPSTPSAQVINEFVASHSGTDDTEYVEVLGQPLTTYSDLQVVQIDGDQLADGGNPGAVDSVHQVGTTDAAGFWTTGFLDHVLANDALTLLLVQDFSGTVGVDLDTDDDGALDAAPWTAVLDSVAIDDSDAGDQLYSIVVLGRGFDENWSYPPGGASRLPDGGDSDEETDWARNDFYGQGLPGFDGDWVPGEAYNTPSAANAPPMRDLVISEFVANHTGSDTFEYVEVVGDPGRNYSRAVVLAIEGDPPTTGTVDAVFPAGVTDSAGLWSTGYLAGALENGTLSLLLVEGYIGGVGDDLDADDDGVIDLPQPWIRIHDSVAVSDSDPSDLVYAATSLGPGFDGNTFTPGGASRLPTGRDSDTVADWVRNDFDGEGLPGLPGSLDNGEAFNTPGRANRVGLSDYYAGVDTGDPSTLRASLERTITDHVRIPYTRPYPWSGAHTWEVLETADQDPNNPANILDVYRNRSFVKLVGDYNREHTWPKSYGFPSNHAGNSPHTDCHQLFLCDSSYNSMRSNHPFATCDSGDCVEAETDSNNGQGGTSGTYPGQSNWYSSAAGRWETWWGRRGDVARAQFYLDVRYRGGANGVTGHDEPDLVLTNTRSLITTSQGNANLAHMGLLSVLLQWHLDDPVDDVERARNDTVSTYQGNRNPFIDHPEWVKCVFAGTICNANHLFSDGVETGDVSRWSAVVGG